MQMNQAKASKSNIREQIEKWCKLAIGTKAKKA
jgi:hypothetical protein